MYAVTDPYFGMRSTRRAAQRRTRSRRAIRYRGKPTKTELHWSGLLVTKAWTRVAVASWGQRARDHRQLAKLVVSGASELVDVQGKAELLIKNDPQVPQSKKLILGKATATV